MITPIKYKNKPEIVEAVVYSRDLSVNEVRLISEWCGGKFYHNNDPGKEDRVYYWALFVPTKYGLSKAFLGDVVVRSASGEFSLLSPAIFKNRYEKYHD